MPSRRERELEELLRLRSERPARPTVDWETASRCPTCEIPMAIVKGPFPLEYNLTARGFYLECRNRNRCRQADLPPFFIEVMADGTVPVRLPGPKQFDAPLLTKEQQARIDEYYREQYLATREKRELRKD